MVYNLFFFFQAEDGIRDLYVTGVQTCALPISPACQAWPKDVRYRADVMASPDDTTAAKRRLRAGGWYVRYTEWPSGHQVVLHLRSDTAVHLVTRWWPTEAEDFEEALSMAAQHELRGRPATATPTAEAGPPSARSHVEGRARDLDVLVLGNAHEDLLVQTARLPAAGEVLEGDLVAHEPGGKGVRQAIAAARLGGRVALVARVGADPHGDEILSRLRVE